MRPYKRVGYGSLRYATCLGACLGPYTRKARNWVLVKGFNVSYQNKGTMLFTIDPYYGNLNLKPLTLQETLINPVKEHL